MAVNEDAAARGRALAEGFDSTPPQTPAPRPAKAFGEEPPESRWDHIPAQQILVVESGGKQIAAVAVDTDEGRALYSQETSPCPTCGQDWTRGARLEGQIKILWPDHYKT